MRDTELLEELQTNFTEQYGLTTLLTDESGNPITPVRGRNELFNQLLNQEPGNLLMQIRNTMTGEWVISKPFIYDFIPGIHVLTAPVNNGHSSKVFLWAGVMVEEQTKPLVKDQLHNIYGHTEADWGKLVENALIIQPENKRKWLQRIDYLAKLMSLCIKEGSINASYDVQAQLFREAVQQDKSIQQLLSHLQMTHREYDFLGLAEKQEEDKYSITQVVGEGEEALQSVSFSPGEGFLGRVLITGDFSYWEDIEHDPRTFLFHRFQFKPKSLFCFPIKRHDGSLSILFGGSISDTKISKEGIELGGTFANILELNLLTSTLRMENSYQLNRLSSLIEICKLMASTPDLKRILYILVDISLNLVEGPFSCVVLKGSESEKVQVVSRGNMEVETGEYVRDLVDRHYGKPFETRSTEDSLPKIHQTAGGDPVIECPLFYRHELLGVLSVGTHSLTHSQLKEQTAFLHTLSIIGGISLYLAKQDHEGFTLDKVELLNRAISQFDPEAYARTEDSAKVVGEFVLKLGLPSALLNEIINACRLSFYSPEFIREVFSDNKIVTIIEEGNNLMKEDGFEGWNEASIGGQIYALVESYIEGRSLKMNQKDKGGIFQEFLSFVNEKKVVEQEFTLSDNPKLRELKSVSSTLKEELNLSPREQEVLGLVIRGLNNRQIAEELYISGHTVKNHVTKIFQKLNVPDRAHAISKVYQLKYGS